MTEITSTYDDGIYINTVAGKVAIEDLADFIINNIPIWKNAAVIWDCTDADFNNLSGVDWIYLFKKLKPYSEHRAGGKAALVGDKDYVLGSLAMLNEWAEVEKYPPHVKTFREIRKAKKWFIAH